MLGYFHWFFQSALAVAAAYVCVARWVPQRKTLERWTASALLASGSMYGVLTLTGAFNRLRLVPVAIVAVLINGSAIAWALKPAGPRQLIAKLWRADLGAPVRLWRDITARHELLAYVLVPAALSLAVSTHIAWYLPNWSWDCAMYHQAQMRYALQEASNHWVPTHMHYINGYPRLLELLAGWNVLFTGNDRLDDAPQIPLALAAALAIGAWAQRFGTTRSLSASAGAMWLLLPAVALQLHTTHADIAAAFFFITAVYFLTSATFSTFDRWMTAVALGLYCAAKITGFFHLVLLSPLIAARWGWLYWRAKGSRLRLTAGLLGNLLLWAVLGLQTLGRNVMESGNPFYPAQLTVPLFGWKLQGPLNEAAIAGPPAFFGAPGALGNLIRLWTTPSVNPFPDIREGPFGALFPYILAPCLLWLLLSAPWSKKRWPYLSLPALAVLAVLVPASWWGRFVLAAPAAGLVAFCIVHQQLKWLTARYLLSAITATVAVWGYSHDLLGYRHIPPLFPSKDELAQVDARMRAEFGWLLPADLIAKREAEFKEGEVWAYDNSVGFMGDYWTHDGRNRAVYVKHAGNDEAYLSELRKMPVRWVSVAPGSPEERSLLSKPGAFQRVAMQPMSSTAIYRVTSAF
ncbi:MAG: hypothetical protein K1X64_07995 [Myxococcaceae bacterium]|nr:hypothetical protein [Myxococcaceae bacterium]